jgi:hypothetical protein
MKNKLRDKKVGIMFLLVFIFSISIYSLNAACTLTVTLVNQDPYPAIPGDYVTVLFQVSGVSDTECKGVSFELVPNYPFSLDENDSGVRTLEGSTWIAGGYKNDWTIPYKLRVDKSALDGESKLQIKYKQKFYQDSNLLDFNITIKDYRTNFDAVIQETSGSDVSIAIANTGKYTANSVVVRIPDQENYKATETSGQMVGNLASGDYTIVSFSLTKIMNQRTSINNTNSSFRQNVNQQNPLKFDIYYTDSLGERRTVNMELPLSLSSSSNLSSVPYDNVSMRSGMNQTKSYIWYKWYFWVIIFVVILLIVYIQKRHSIKEFFHKRKHSSSSNVVPDWIKNTMEKEKKK